MKYDNFQVVKIDDWDTDSDGYCEAIEPLFNTEAAAQAKADALNEKKYHLLPGQHWEVWIA